MRLWVRCQLGLQPSDGSIGVGGAALICSLSRLLEKRTIPHELLAGGLSQFLATWANLQSLSHMAVGLIGGASQRAAEAASKREHASKT